MKQQIENIILISECFISCGSCSLDKKKECCKKYKKKGKHCKQCPKL